MRLLSTAQLQSIKIQSNAQDTVNRETIRFTATFCSKTRARTRILNLSIATSSASCFDSAVEIVCKLILFVFLDTTYFEKMQDNFYLQVNTKYKNR